MCGTGRRQASGGLRGAQHFPLSFTDKWFTMRSMADSTPATAASPAPLPTVTHIPLPPTVLLKPRRPATIFAALGNPIRCRVLARLAESGQAWTVSQLSTRERVHPDTMSRHLQILEKAGMVASHPGVDRRCQCYFVPGQFRQTPGTLDFGCCTVKLER
jgi:hypothetical protein